MPNTNPNKIDIMQRVAFCGVPQGAHLRQDSHPAIRGILIAKVTPGDNSGGLEVVRARLFFEGLEAIMHGIGPAPDAPMLRRLHEACIEMSQRIINSLIIEEMMVQIVDEHRAKIAVIVDIARELDLAYDQPEDPFLKQAA